MKDLAKDATIAWFSALRSSDPLAVNFLVRELRPRVLNDLVRQGADSQEAEDIFMNVIESIFRKIRERQEPFFDDRKFEAYFIHASRRQWYKKYGKKRRVSLVTNDKFEVLESEWDIEQELIQTEQAKLLWKTFQQLGEDCQKVLKLFVMEEHPHQEIAERMGYSYQYAKKKKYRCFQKLLEMIKKDPLHEELKNA